MNASLFIEFVERFFRQVVGKITEKFNGKSAEPTFLFNEMLEEEYSADLKWGATEINHSIVAADVVALDSSLPLKSRDKMANASGNLPKLGMKMRKGEKLLTDIQIAIARGADESTVASKIFDDTAKVIRGIDVRTECMFEEALSTGLCVVEEENNTGTGVRVDYGYKAENKFGTSASPWDKAGALPQDDVQQLFDKAAADSASISHVYLSKKYFDLFRRSEQGRLLVATYNNVVVTNQSLVPVPSRSAFLAALEDEYGATFHVVDNVFVVENVDGTKKSIRPWKESSVVGVPDAKVGRLVYGTLAEETNPVEGVAYEKAGNSILVSKYSKTDPLEEFTAAQSLRLPVLDGASGFYMLDAAEEGLALDATTLTFPKSAASREINFTSVQGEVTATASEAWLTLTVANGKVTAAAAANSGAERTATITVNSGEYEATVSVTQAGA